MRYREELADDDAPGWSVTRPDRALELTSAPHTDTLQRCTATRSL